MRKLEKSIIEDAVNFAIERLKAKEELKNE